MRIIVEGPDGGGKSTLIARLIGTFPVLEVIVNEKGPDQLFPNWWYTVLMPEYTSHTPLHDRFLYSELIYGPILRGSLAADRADIEGIQRGLRQEALLIYARPPRDVLEIGIRQEQQMKGVTDKITELVEAYDRLMSVEQGYYGRRFYLYNWTGDNEPQQVVKHVQRYLTGELE